MKDHAFVKGMAMGVVTGAAMVAAMMPKKRVNMKKAAGKAMKAAGQMMEDISETMGFH